MDQRFRFCDNPSPWDFRPVKKGFPSAWPFGIPLGPLEQQILGELWSRGSATVRELLEDQTIKLAYTTVMTTMDRLYKKRLLDRVEEGRAYRYFPRHKRDEMRRVAALESIRQLFRSRDSSSLPLSYLVEALIEHDEQLLDELQDLVERKRRELRKREQS
jgi:predicted transcriptional regulator